MAELQNTPTHLQRCLNPSLPVDITRFKHLNLPHEVLLTIQSSIERLGISSFKDLRAALIVSLIDYALRKTNNNFAQAARLLSPNRTTLLALFDQYIGGERPSGVVVKPRRFRRMLCLQCLEIWAPEDQKHLDYLYCISCGNTAKHYMRHAPRELEEEFHERRKEK